MNTHHSDVWQHGDWYAHRLAVLVRKHSDGRCSEADVSMNLVRPCIERILRYPAERIDAEASMHGKRPDYVCRGANGQAEVIVEVKNVDTFLRRRVAFQAAWHTSPYGQIERYLEKYPLAYDGTWGILTNGKDWIVLRRSGQDIVQVKSVTIQRLADVKRLLTPVRQSRWDSSGTTVDPDDLAPNNWLNLLKDPALTPSRFIECTRPTSSNMTIDVQGHAFALIREITPPPPSSPPPIRSQFSGRNIWLACLRMSLPDRHIAPPDITEELRPLVTKFESYRVYGIVYWNSSAGETRCRGFLWERDALSTTSVLDPHLPGSRGDKQIKDLAGAGFLDNASNVLNGNELRTEFYEDIDKWFKRTPRSRNDLRHMIRILFAWLLQERRVLPSTALWDPSEQFRPKGTEIHEHLIWLFTDILAVEKSKRRLEVSASPRLHALSKHVPFLNGSLFTALAPEDEPKVLANRNYVEVGENPGLLTILRRYDWTLHEQSGYESESALDPSMLGTLFERLMLSVEGPRIESSGEIRMPGGSYYTPQDVVDEMVSESVAHWLGGKISGFKYRQLRDLMHPVPKETGWRQWSQTQKRELLTKLQNVTVLDPCCGSGAFTVGMLQALRRANRRLASSSIHTFGPGSLEWIVEKQLHATDIHPIAVLITRLRLFIAWIDAQRKRGSGKVNALPNLETRCVAADTLSVELSKGVQLLLGSDKWDKAIRELQEARELWVYAHKEDDKFLALQEERKARRVLKDLAKWRVGYDSRWLDADFISTAEQPMSVDVRKLLVAPEGWDIIIGNPPYQNSERRERERGEKLGYIARTNLYTMFVEAAMELAKNDGCVTLIVPHSIVFRRFSAFRDLRQQIEKSAQRIDIQTYDNGPDPVFPDVPWIKSHRPSHKSRQRVTILSVNKGSSYGQSNVFSGGLIRLKSQRRGEILRTEHSVSLQPKYIRQWTQAPSTETVALLRKMWSESKTTRHSTNSGATRMIAFPKTGMYFVSCLPCELSPLRAPTLHSLINDQYFWPWIALYNSHLFHAYWLVTGDAFHITAMEFATVQPPTGWNDESLRSQLERQARQLVSARVVSRCKTMFTGRGGSRWPNVNFHKSPESQQIISVIDRLLIECYGLEEQPLLDHIREMRTGSAHNIVEP